MSQPTLRADRLAKHFALAAQVAAAGLTASSTGAVVARQVDLVIPADANGLYLNLETGHSSGNAFEGCDFNAYGNPYCNIWSAPSWGTGYVDFGYGGPSGYTNLPVGMGIDHSLYFAESIGTYPQGSEPFQWSLNSMGFIGIRFVASDNLTHYGWVAIQFGNTETDRRIVAYGYESVAGQGIAVGAIPAPGAIGLLGAAGLVGKRRRR